MNRKIFLQILFLLLPALAGAQESSQPPATAKPDSVPALQKLNQDRSPRPAAETPAGSKATGLKQAGAEKKEEPDGEEINLGTVAIQAVIEKPNVDIIPKRAEPDWEETRALERSFGQELKEVPDDLMLRDEELDRAQKLETLKKADPPKDEKKK